MQVLVQEFHNLALVKESTNCYQQDGFLPHPVSKPYLLQGFKQC
jgi:hypothetical protein